ncbi:phosphatase PAP2 family protein [Streptomyces sp. URMC 123]|uniref:phosphatase PAP2 family protein n=1 Tax=Streptomyces sp. URMC 123 TaxID=3423403 RepID=UPI003F1CEFAE
MDSTDLYRDITDFARTTPGWVHSLTEFGTDAGLVVLAAVVLLAWWRARRGDGRAMALALVAPVTAILAYATSEVAKLLIEEERPCRAVAGAAARTIAECPPPGDWSFPSNHATIAAALAVGAVFAWRRIAVWALPLAVLMAASRVFVGVHYPHDVAAGLLLGAAVAALGAVLLVRPGTAVVERLRRGPLRPLLSRSR